LPPKPDPLYCAIGAASGLGMLIWCIAFRRHEQVLARCGWIMAAIGLLIACYLPSIT
jgi:hypothetical protein